MDNPYASIVGARLRSLVSSRFLFAARSAGDALLVFVEAVAPVLLIAQFGSLAGWNGAEVALLIGIGRAGEGLALSFARGVDPSFFSETVRLGRFDQVLIRPVSPLGWLLASEVEIRHVFRTVVGVAVVAWCVNAANVDLTVAKVLVIVMAIIAVATLVAAFLVMGGALTLRTVEGSEVANLFALGGLSLAAYPLDVYAGALRFVFTFVIPVGMCVYVPTLYVLDRDGPGVLGPNLLPAVPVVIVVLAALAGLSWRAGVRRYQSTGS